MLEGIKDLSLGWSKDLREDKEMGKDSGGGSQRKEATQSSVEVTNNVRRGEGNYTHLNY